MIVGTAGHIDHGKTTLVRALTGVDTDRLPEERRRGITIELGFAPLQLPGMGLAGVVDVPGHEAFVRTMLAGATGIDVALLVIAADEGVMPQTREHLAILSLLGIRGGVVALTKADLVDPEWLALVADDVRSVLAGSALESGAIVPVSAPTGVGLDALRLALADAARAAPPREAFSRFRMPVDRAFTVRGTGTVATGTVWSGAAARDGFVTAFPGGARLRVRGVHRHGESVAAASAGDRAALALAGVELADLPRGAVLVAGDGWQESRVMRATVELSSDAAGPLRPRARVRLHLGTADVGARVVAAGGPLQPGERRPVRIALDAPLVARGGDRFVLRSPSPALTIGGGVITDPHPPHRRVRPLAALDLGPLDALVEMLTEAGAAGVPRAGLAVRLGLDDGAVADVVAALGDGVVRIDDRLYPATAVERVVAAIEAAVERFHVAHPLDDGMPRQHARGLLHAGASLAEHALAVAVGRGRLVQSRAVVHRAGWAPTPTDAQRALQTALVGAIEAAGREPPTVGELAERLGAAADDAAQLLRLVERAGAVVAIEPERYYSPAAEADLRALLVAALADDRVLSPGEMRQVLGVSRKFLIPLLEHFDRLGVTRRVAEGRALGGTQFASGTPSA